MGRQLSLFCTRTWQRKKAQSIRGNRVKEYAGEYPIELSYISMAGLALRSVCAAN